MLRHTLASVCACVQMHMSVSTRAHTHVCTHTHTQSEEASNQVEFPKWKFHQSTRTASVAFHVNVNLKQLTFSDQAASNIRGKSKRKPRCFHHALHWVAAPLHSTSRHPFLKLRMFEVQFPHPWHFPRCGPCLPISSPWMLKTQGQNPGLVRGRRGQGRGSHSSKIGGRCSAHKVTLGQFESCIWQVAAGVGNTGSIPKGATFAFFPFKVVRQ